MDAIEKLQAEIKNQGERADYYRRAGMRAESDFERVKYRQLEQLAVDTIYGLSYAIAVLKS